MTGPTRARAADGRDRERPEPPEPLPIPVVDNHCHLDISDGDWLDPDDALERAAAVGVPRIVQVGCDLPGARWAVETAAAHPPIVAAVALHPNEAPVLERAGALDDALAEIESLAASEHVRAVGETGLDYFRTGPDGVHVQQESFRRHIALAKELGLALQIHDRDAHEDVLRILAEEGAPEHTVLHCYSGDADMARECVRRGYLLSFAGTLTFKNAAHLRQALAVTPLEHVLVETDAPYLTPSPYRGRPNNPAMTALTVRCVAEVLGEDLHAVCRTISETSERVYGEW